ncbi:hypothetical protein H4R34_003817 [Dimargaris verticillata]|uniref:CREG-like beta-barrel domain-containing protein n=1 Tax=Dimargaris verticillata TaxID=2761393 RepID=A0A9W8B6S4_9FUNG|nr:hypothetical protein H4R34_003817 [Dimargaris verticillata]
MDTARETVADAARLARQLVTNQALGTLTTVMADSTVHPAPVPFGTMEYFVDDSRGNLVLLISNLSVSAKNRSVHPTAAVAVRSPTSTAPAMTQPRVTLSGQLEPLTAEDASAERERYLQRHPDAQSWVGWSDFRFYRLQVQAVYYIGGFGGAHYIGSVPLDLYRSQGALISDVQSADK